MDYSDLFDTLAFFEGAPDGSTPGNQHLAKKIGERGKQFVKDRWRKEDLQSFGLLQLMEVSRARVSVLSPPGSPPRVLELHNATLLSNTAPWWWCDSRAYRTFCVRRPGGVPLPIDERRKTRKGEFRVQESGQIDRQRRSCRMPTFLPRSHHSPLVVPAQSQH